MENQKEYLRNDGYYYQAYGDSTYGRLRVVDADGNFVDGLSMRLKDFSEACSISYLLADSFNKGYRAGIKSGSFYL